MSRKRTLICVTIVTDQPWAVGAAPDLYFRPSQALASADGDSPVRMPILRTPSADGMGDPFVAASSLVGSLRRHLGDQAEDWLGPADLRDDGEARDDDISTSSALRCLGAFVPTATVTRTVRTAIDPSRGAAAAGSLREEENIGAGTTLLWWLEWDHTRPTKKLSDLTDLLRSWQPIIGRQRATQHGRSHVLVVQPKTVDLDDKFDLTWWLNERTTLAYDRAPNSSSASWVPLPGTAKTQDCPVISVQFEVIEPLHLGVGKTVEERNEGGHGTHKVKQTGEVVPSSSWRGIFRHRVEHILRVTGTPEAANTVRLLFGTGRTKGASTDAGERGLLRFGDSPIAGHISAQQHVAIDRITGGAKTITSDDDEKGEGVLFTNKRYGRGSMLTLNIYVDGGVLDDSQTWLLQQVVRDIDDGVIGIGAFTSRGYGTLKATQQSWPKTKVEQ